MYSAKGGQARVDRFVLAFGVLLACVLAGILTNIPALLMLPLPLLIALLVVLSVLDGENGWPDRTTMTVICSFHGISAAFWVVALITLGSEGVVIGGLPASIGLLTLVAWPFYTLVSGPLYAFCAERLGWTNVVRESNTHGIG